MTASDGHEQALSPGTSVGGFVVEELVAESAWLREYRAREPQLERHVALLVSRGEAASRLRADVRRIASVTHPAVVPVLASGRDGDSEYVAVPDLDAITVGEFARTREPRSDQVARVIIDLAGAVEALAHAGLRVSLDRETALVTPAGRGLVDPLRAGEHGESGISEADAVSSTHELADLLASLVATPPAEIASAVAAVRSGEYTRPSELALALERSSSQLQRPQRRRALVLGVVGVAVAAVAALLLVRSDGTDKETPPAVPATAAAARVVERIPLGLAKNEGATGVAFTRGAIWIPTSKGRLLRVDPATNQIVGSPLVLRAGGEGRGIAVSAGSVWIADFGGSLFRVDPETSRVTGKLELGRRLYAVQAAGDVLWVARAAPGGHHFIPGPVDRGEVIRVDARTMRRIGAPIPVMATPFALAIRGKQAWVLGNRPELFSLLRIDLATGKRVSLNVGVQPQALALHAGTLWVTTYYDGTITPIDADAMTFRRSLQVERAARGIQAGADDLWVVVADAEGGYLRLERRDAHSGRRSGRPVGLGAQGTSLTSGETLAVRPEGIWALTDAALIRLAPTRPRPSLRPAPRAATPRALESGPLPAGTWTASAFAQPFSFSVPAYRWIASHPQRDSFSLTETRGERHQLSVDLPKQIWVDDTKLEPVGDPEHMLARMRANPRLRVTSVKRIELDGKPAIQLMLTERNAIPHKDICFVPCVPLYTVPFGGFAVFENEVDRFTLVADHGRTISIVESGGRRSDYAALLRTFRFDG
jgi:streptogramin lyase